MAADRDGPTVVIVEPYRDIAIALEEIVSLARCTPLTVGAVDEPATLLQERPAAIIVRVATDLSYRSPHAGLARWPRTMRPLVVALVSTDADVAEAEMPERVEDGLEPRSFPSFWAAADEAGISRLYGGIHYRAAIELGAAQGKCIAGYSVALKTWRQ